MKVTIRDTLHDIKVLLYAYYTNIIRGDPPKEYEGFPKLGVPYSGIV